MPDLPHWPERLIALARDARDGDARARHRSREELWLLVSVVLRQRLRARAHAAGGLPGADLDDLASQKVLDLLAKFDSGGWDPTRSSPGEVAGFMTTVARNAVVDAIRHRSRHRHVEEEEIEREQATAAPAAGAYAADAAESALERGRFADSLVRCAAGLTPRDRLVWMLRVLLELPSREIAAHPEVGLRADHVDVVLQRCRQRLRECMVAAGFDTSQLPPGTFAALWETYGMSRRVEEGE